MSSSSTSNVSNSNLIWQAIRERFLSLRLSNKRRITGSMKARRIATKPMTQVSNPPWHSTFLVVDIYVFQRMSEALPTG
jgi:hypothetical protein